MGTHLFNRVLNGVLNGISTSTCSIPKRFDSQPYIYICICIYIYISIHVVMQNRSYLNSLHGFLPLAVFTAKMRVRMSPQEC